jgi:hypothetical protein
MLEPGLSEMDVHIEESWGDDFTRQVDHLGRGSQQAPAELLDRSVVDQEIAFFVPPRHGIDKPSALQ